MKKIFLAFMLVVHTSACNAEELQSNKMRYIGNIPLGCGSIESDKVVTTLSGFAVSPERAVELAVEYSYVKCNSKFLQQIHADDQFYYISKPAFGNTADYIIKNSVRINGETGEVIFFVNGVKVSSFPSLK